MELWLLAAGGAVSILALALKLRGPRGGSDLTAPPKRRGRAFGAAEAERIGTLVARGEQDEALRLIRAAGHGEAEARRVIALIERLGGGEGAANGEGER